MGSLIICEKNLSAQRIANILSGGKAKRRYIKKVPVYEFEVKGQKHSVIGLRGHIMALDFPKEFNEWSRVSPRELIKIEPLKIIESKEIASALEELAKEYSKTIIATDYDREGELIGVEGLEIVRKVNPDIEFKRAKFSALTDWEVKNAFENLTDVDFKLSKSAEARQNIDLVWGASLTRFISLTSEQLGRDFLSVGRVQSPTLALIVDREKEIMNFKPEPYWEIVAELEKSLRFSGRHSKGKFLSKEEAERAFNNARRAERGIVIKVESEERKEFPPSPFNTTSFLQSANGIGYTAANAMRIAEELYMKGLISYPRTDNTVYPKSLNLKQILKRLEKSVFKKEVKEVLAQETIYPTRGKKIATDHPPIHPVSPADKNKLSDDQWRIYELVVRRFLATLSPPAVVEITRVETELNNELFITKGYRTLVHGWKRYYPYMQVREVMLPKLSEGDYVKVIEVKLLDRKTKPPKRYTQGNLIQMMESLGLGTKSTRHEIIQKLYQRGYIEGSPASPTQSGFAVTEALENHAETITKPEMTAILEKDMIKIAEGEKGYEEVVRESQEILEEVISVLERHEKEIGESIKEALRMQNVIGTCSKCGSDMVIIKSKKGKRFVGCTSYPQCDNSFPLPQKGRIVPTRKVCEECRSPKVKVVSKGKRAWEICINPECPLKKGNDSGKLSQ